MGSPTTPEKTPRLKSWKTRRSPTGEKSISSKKFLKRKQKTESDESIDDSDFDPEFSARMLLNAGKCRFLKPI